jgi:hypothetical protein
MLMLGAFTRVLEPICGVPYLYTWLQLGTYHVGTDNVLTINALSAPIICKTVETCIDFHSIRQSSCILEGGRSCFDIRPSNVLLEAGDVSVLDFSPFLRQKLTL